MNYCSFEIAKTYNCDCDPARRGACDRSLASHIRANLGAGTNAHYVTKRTASGGVLIENRFGTTPRTPIDLIARTGELNHVDQTCF